MVLGESGKQRLQFFVQRAIDPYQSILCRGLESERGSMEEESLQSIALHNRIVRRTVAFIPGDRVIDVSGMHANLMRAPGHDAHAAQHRLRKSAQRREVCHRIFPGWIGANMPFSSPSMIGGQRHLH